MSGTVAEPFDCRRCGACCCNTDLNRSSHRVDYVRVDDDDALLADDVLSRRWLHRGTDGGMYVRLEESQRCSALTGTLGHEVRCDIYDLRPTGCRLVEPGGEECLRARRERGIDRS